MRAAAHLALDAAVAPSPASDSRVALITGGASGIGRATADRLAAEAAPITGAAISIDFGLTAGY